MSQNEDTIYGYLDVYERALVSIKLVGGEQIVGQIDTGFNGLMLFSYFQALEYGIALPKERRPFPGAGGGPVFLGELERFPYYWFGNLCYGTIFIAASPEPGSLAGMPFERNPPVLLGTRLLRGCQLSIVFDKSTSFAVSIRKIALS
jgi:hypothetical protein